MKAFQSNFTGTKRMIARFIAAILCAVLCVSQVIAGCRMIRDNDDLPPLSTSEDYDDFHDGMVINGMIDEVLFQALDDTNASGQINVYFARSKTDHVVAFRVPLGSKMDEQMEKLLTGEGEPVYYKGVARMATALYQTFLRREVDLRQIKKQFTLSRPTKEAVTGLMVDVSPNDASYSEKAIVVTFVSAVLLLLAFLLLMWKPIRLMIETIASEKGKYQPELAVTKDDITFETQGFYNGEGPSDDSFFVNTDYNIRDYGVYKDEDSPADKSQLPSNSEDVAMNRNEQGDPLFYSGEVNEEGNFYVDSKREASTDFGKEMLNKRY